jgi:hypothetical protein
MLVSRKITVALVLVLLGAGLLSNSAKANIAYDLTLIPTSGTQTANPATLILKFDNFNNLSPWCQPPRKDVWLWTGASPLDQSLNSHV